MVFLDLTYWRSKSFYVNPSVECTNDCLFCVRNFQDGVYGFKLAGDRNPTPEQVRIAIENTWDEQFTDAAIVGFGEPSLNLDASLKAITTINQISDVPVRMDTNGHAPLIHPERDVPCELANAGLESIQVSLNASSAERYVRLCQPKYGPRAYEAMLKFAERCKESLHVVLSVVDLPGVDIEACRRISEDMQVDFRVREFKGPSMMLDVFSKKLGRI